MNFHFRKQEKNCTELIMVSIEGTALVQTCVLPILCFFKIDSAFFSYFSFFFLIRHFIVWGSFNKKGEFCLKVYQ